MMARFYARSLFVATLAFLVVACGTDPEVAKQEFLASGDAFAAQGKYREAALDYRNAIQQDPRFGEARLRLAEAYLKLNEPQNAYGEFIRAADLLPQNLDAQVKAAQMLLLAGRFEDAQTRAQAAVALDSKNVDAQLILGNSLAGLKEYDEAIAQIEEAIALDPERSVAYQSLGNVELARGNQDRAEAAFKRAADTAPAGSVAARLALGNFYMALGRQVDAEAVLKAAVESVPDDAAANRAMAMFYFGTARPAAGEPYLRTFAEVGPNGRGKLTLASYYIARQRLDEAQSTLESIDPADPDTYNSAQLGLSDLSVRKGDRVRARALVDGVLERQPSHTDALVSSAQLLAADGRISDAVASAQQAVDANPGSSRAQFALGRLRGLNRQGGEAMAAFVESSRLNPAYAAPDYEIAQLHLGSFNLPKAKEFGESALRKAPGFVDAMFLLARVGTLQRDFAGAQRTLAQVPMAARSRVEYQMEVGRLALAQNNRGAARSAFERVVSSSPRHPDALAALSLIDVEDNRAAAATARMDRVLRENPRDAQLLMIDGRLRATVNDSAGAEASLRKAVEIDPGNLGAYALLGRLYVSQRKVDQAIVQFQRIVERDPKSLSALTMIGMLYESQGKLDDARRQYEAALSADPRAVVAANNLAWLHADSGENLDAALQLVQMARSALPESPEVADTLGWVFYKKGLASSAIGPLKEAAERQPANASFLLHLGLAYSRNGDVTLARQTLQSALKAAPNGPGAAEAQAELKRLSSLGS